MSSFSENFQREDTTKGGNAQYDDSAFYSFASTMLLVAIISLIIVILRRLNIENKFSDKKYKNCTCCKGYVYKCNGDTCKSLGQCYCKMSDECENDGK